MELFGYIGLGILILLILALIISNIQVVQQSRAYVVERLGGGFVRRPKVADVRPVRRCNLLLPILHLAVGAHRELHVALSRAEPHLAYDNIRQDDLVLARHAEFRPRRARLKRREFNAPASVDSGCR